jgi:hypothetical protein
MKSKMKHGLNLTVAGLLLCCLPAGAALVEMDYLVSGDKQITRDTVNNIDWLDFDVAVNYSVTDILGGAGGFLADGWTVATEAQADTLYLAAGVTAGTVNANSLALRDLLGLNTWAANSAYGILDSGMAIILKDSYTGPTFGNSFGTTFKNSGVGVALVKAVPEPATATILFGGTAFLVAVRRFGRRRF